MDLSDFQKSGVNAIEQGFPIVIHENDFYDIYKKDKCHKPPGNFNDSRNVGGRKQNTSLKYRFDLPPPPDFLPADKQKLMEI